MLDILVAEPATVLADGQSNAVAAGLVVGPGILGVKSLNRILAFNADWHVCLTAPIVPWEDDIP